MRRLAAATVALSSLSLVASQVGERFPLSGVIQNGISVRVTGKLSNNTGLAAVDFETPNGQVPFRFNLNCSLDGPQVQRTSNFESGEFAEGEIFGGFPFNIQDEEPIVTIDFLKTKGAWKVSIDGQRMPWFDFSVNDTAMTSHVRIYEGILHPNVQLSRPACTTPCHVDECTDATTGGSICSDADGNILNASSCFTVSPEEKCSVSQASYSEAALHCCEGIPVFTAFADTEDNEWMEVSSDAGLVDAACKAFGDSDCTDLAGSVVQIKSRDAEANRYSVWTPRLDKADQSKVRLIPPHITKHKDPLGTVVDVRRDRMPTTSIDEGLLLVTHAEGGLKDKLVGKFISLIHDTHRGAWKAYTTARWNRIFADPDVHLDGIQLLVTDTVAEAPSCSDITVHGHAWRDRKFGPYGKRRSCQDYKNKGYCTIRGHKTRAFEKHHGGRNSHMWMFTTDGYDATGACCACGGGKYGGSHDVPPSTLPFAMEGEEEEVAAEQVTA